MSHTKKTKEHKANQQWTEKMLMLLLADSLIILISYFTALLLRFDFVFSSIPQEYLTGYLWSMPFWIISTVVVFYICRLYHSIWRLASVAELQMILIAYAVLAVVYSVGMLFMEMRMPRSYYFIGFLLSFLLTTGMIYLEVKEKLNRGKIVYFSGTPCQVDGLIAFLGKEYDNLICQDIICHGVPSPKIWKQYLKQFNIEKNAKILFRDKRTGWESYSFTIDQREKYTQRASENLYMKVFLNNLCLRPSCYQCHSKGNFRKSDITLGDFWGVEKVCSEMYNEKGTSLILINSEKGKKIFGKIKRNLKIKEINIEEAIKYNESIYKSAFENKKREKFMSEIDKKKESFNNIAWKYVKDPVILRVKKKLYNLLNC